MAKSAVLWCLILVGLCSVLVSVTSAEKLQLVYQWSQLRSSTKNNASQNVLFSANVVPSDEDTFNAYGNLPMGVTHHKGFLYVTIPRRRPGIPATLNVIDMSRNPAVNEPTLDPYPNSLVNSLRNDFAADPKRIISVYRTQVDRCDRLWFVDTGYLEYPGGAGRQVQRPALWVIDLTIHRSVRRFEIPEDMVEFGYGIPNIEVDVDEEDCGRAYAYIPDYEWRMLYVYGLTEGRMWRFKHNYFSFEPRYGDFNIAEQQFTWYDGIFSVAVGGQWHNSETERTVYLHAMASVSEIAVSNRILQNETLAQLGNGAYGQSFHHLGARGPNAQSSSHAYDPKTGVLFYAEINRNAVGCWNTKKQFTPENHGIVHLDNEEMIYPADLRIDSNGDLWVISNRLPIWIYSHLNRTDVNYRIWRQSASRAIAGTICA
ncbi:L-dopachrome tautomerase yellow-f2-like [Anopheles maculipalpis]|uniref:L-dopachrome tautomerase yellow-f2-like n=1 Tax=Anopheles maculipalpis TaxID=1496333 RepID=UPI002158FFD0|nr:L-dopachrome tautomerase yellow-f2-like [Anopheles maculipalpis]